MTKFKLMVTENKIDSRQVAEMVGKEHSNLMRDIRGYVEIIAGSENSTLNSQDFFVESSYKTEGNNKTYSCFLITRKGCEMVANKMIGEKGVLFTAAYIEAFHEMEKELGRSILPDFTDPVIAARAWADAMEAKKLSDVKVLELEGVIEEQKPAVNFTNQCLKASNSVLVREVAKLASDEGYKIGQNKLYEKLREWGLIIKGKTEPTQKGINSGYFEVVERSVDNFVTGEVKVVFTTKVTPKGQVYIIDRLMNTDK